MTGLHLHVRDRQDEYKQLLDVLVDDMEGAISWLTYYRGYYERNQHLLQ